MKPKSLFLKTLTVVLSAASISSFAATLAPKLLGEMVPPTAAKRTIVIQPNTRFVHVESGEAVKFVIGDQEFGWQFDGPEGPFDLGQIVPAAALDHKVRGYVDPNPLYMGD